VDSRQAVEATSGALQNLTSYLNGTTLLANLNSAFQGSNEYISETLGIHPGIVYSSLAAAIVAALPLTMSRYPFSRSPISPYGAMPGVPHIDEADFSYITSQDLDDPTLAVPVDDLHHSRSYAPASPNPDDDVLIIKNRGIIYPAHFPAYSIGDGKLIVEDVRERVGLLMDLSDRTRRRVKLLYKGKQLKDPRAPVREYGCKNKSELLAVVPEGDDGGSSLSDEEMVVVSDKDSKSKRKRKRRSKKKTDPLGSPEGNSTTSPRDSNSNFEVPNSPSSVASSGAMRVLDELSHEFKTKWQPLCLQYTASPPDEDKKRIDEHRKLSESVMQHILLKLDGVETDGVPEIRARRKELVRQVQEILKELDVAKASGQS
jgi:hypothetical protein